MEWRAAANGGIHGILSVALQRGKPNLLAVRGRRQRRRQHRNQRAPTATADVLLVHLELDARVRPFVVAAAQVRDQRVGGASIRIIPSQYELGRGGTYGVVPRVDEPHLAGPCRVVEEADIAVAYLAVQDRRETV